MPPTAGISALWQQTEYLRQQLAAAERTNQALRQQADVLTTRLKRDATTDTAALLLLTEIVAEAQIRTFQHDQHDRDHYQHHGATTQQQQQRTTLPPPIQLEELIQKAAEIKGKKDHF